MGTCSRGRDTRSPSPSASGAPGRRTLPACLGPEEEPGCAPGVGLGSGRGRGRRLGPPTPQPSIKASTSAHQAPIPEGSAGSGTPARDSQVLNPLPTGLSGAGQGSWSPATPWASPAPPGLSLPTAKGLSGLAARPAGITPASGKSRAVCRGPGAMEWPHPRTTQAGAHTWLHPQRPQDVPVPQNL